MADLRVGAVGPPETRVDGNVDYSITVSNIGLRTAKDVVVQLEGGAALLLSLSSTQRACSPATGFQPVDTLVVTCSLASLAPREKLSIDLGAQAVALGRITLHVRATSATRDARARNNGAVVRTPVFAADSVQVAASRRVDGHPDIDLTLDAVSGRHGQDPDGRFVLDWEGHATGRVTCLSVSGNTAYVGVAIDDPQPPTDPDAVSTPYLLFGLTDNGSPGVGRDTLTFAGGPSPFSCADPSFPVTPGLEITGGEITIVDTP